MKKILGALIASFAFIQAMPAIPSSLGQSLIEFQTILSSSLIQSVIPQSEFIFDVERKTDNLTANVVFYEITTHTPSLNGEVTAEEASSYSNLANYDEAGNYNSRVSHSHHHHHQQTENKYKVRLELTPNPQIGPRIVTVVSIVPTH